MSEKTPAKKTPLWRTVLSFVIELAVLWIVFHYIIFFAYVPTTSMVPTVPQKSVMLVSYLHGEKEVERGDVVVFWSEEYQERMVKRVVGLPGEKIVLHQGELFINDEPYAEDYVINKDVRSATFEVPEGAYLFLGDNRDNSEDARWWNDPYIEAEELVGKVRCVVWPLNEISLIK